MQSEVREQNVSIRRHMGTFLGVLILPVTLGVLAPFVETSWLLAEGGWWRSLTSEQQLAFVLQWSLVWVLSITGLALIVSLCSQRWREAFWKPLIKGVIKIFRVIRASVSLIGFALVSQKDLDRPWRSRSFLWTESRH